MCRKTGCHFGTFAICAIFAAVFGALPASTAQAVTIAYWDFNDSVGTTGPANLIVDQGAGTLTTNFVNPPDSLQNFSGTAIGVLPGTPTKNQGLALTAGAELVNNGRYITFAVNTTGQTNIVLSYATRRSQTGFSNDQVSYSTNGGGIFTDFGAPYSPPHDWALRIVDFGALLDNNANIQIRITFDGAVNPPPNPPSTAQGNNRLDNILIASGGVPTGACCAAPGGGCTNSRTRSQCLTSDLGIYLGDGTTCTGGCPTYSNVVINEIRIAQVGSDFDEYFEIAGPVGAKLDGLSYVVIGDLTDPAIPNPAAAEGSGVVEMALDLSGKVIPASGRFLCAADNITLEVLLLSASPHVAPNLMSDLNFEDTDNVTHLLVAGFRGSVDDDLDTNDDCTLDVTPWVTRVDSLAFVQRVNPPDLINFPYDECYYDFGAGTLIGPTIRNGTPFPPAQVYRYDAALNPKDGVGRPWIIDGGNNVPPGSIDAFDPLYADDTPGAVNAKSTGACCVGLVASNVTRGACLSAGGVWQGRDVPISPNPCSGACCSSTFTCTQTSRALCTSGGGAFQGSATLCPPSGPDPCPCIMDLTSGRQLTWFTGVRFCNVVVTNTTDLVSSTSSKNFMVQDTSGFDGQTAITVFGANQQIDQALSGVGLGYSIDIQGTIINFLGQLELANGDNQNPVVPKPLVTFTNHGFVGIPPAKVITLAELQDNNPAAEYLESEYVQVNCVAFVDGNGTNEFRGFFSGIDTGNYYVTDGTNYAIVRLSTNALDFQGQPIPTGPVNLRGIFFQFDNLTQFPPPYTRGYEILLRGLGPCNGCTGPDDCDGCSATGNPPEAAPNCGATGACCLPVNPPPASQVPPCRVGLNQVLCAGLGGVYRGDGTNCTGVNCPTTDGVEINEIRIDEPTANDPNEYFELKGPPNTAIGSLTYVVIGSGSAAQLSGVIQAAIPLTRQSIGASGLFLAANAANFTLGGTVNLNTTLINFADSDNVTHLLVEHFTGHVNDDLDGNNDGVLDLSPWSRVLSSIAVVQNVGNPPVGTGWWYGPTVGPVPGGFAPGHVIRCPGALNDFSIGSFATAGGNDTPGAENNCTAACLTCPGDVNGSTVVDLGDLGGFVNALLEIAPNPCADVNVDGKSNGQDIPPFIRLALASGNAGTACLPGNHRDIFQCGAPVDTCPSGNFTWCVYQVDVNQAGISPCIVVGPSGATTLSEGEQFCVKCPVAGNCGTLNSKVFFRWVSYAGAGNDCTFQATVTNTNCITCSSGKRFGDPPPPSQITLLDWNILNYTSGRETDFRNVLNAIQPDLVITQEIKGLTGANNFLSVLNTGGGPGGFTLATFADNQPGDTDQALYFKSAKFTENGHANIPTEPRITDRWTIRVTGLPTPANDIYIYSTHLKASDTQSDIDRRTAAATIMRNDANALPAGSNIIYAGDFNTYTSAEGCYVQFTGSQADNDGQCFDPLIGQSGAWHDNATFTCVHTQSPHNAQPGAPPNATGGGLDDRFDFMLISAALNDGIGMTYKPGSYRAYGQDCSHLNNDVNVLPTIPEGSTIANSLHASSDHLPVVMQLLLPNP